MNAEIRQLRSSDVRQRRRAVRRLFELNDPSAIDAFVPLLDDSDEWFRARALQAIGAWAAAKDLVLIERLAASENLDFRLCAARVARRSGKSSDRILAQLCDDENPNVRSIAWQERFIDSDNIADLVKEAFDSPISSIRISAIRASASMDEIPSSIIEAGLTDSSDRVRSATIGLFEERGELNENGEWDEHLINAADGKGESRLKAIILLVSNGHKREAIAKRVPDWFSSSDAKSTKSLVTAFRGLDWSQEPTILDAVKATENERLVAGLLRRNTQGNSNSLRAELLTSDERSIELRARLLEDLIGVSNIDSATRNIIESLLQSEHESIKQNAAFLLDDINSRT